MYKNSTNVIRNCVLYSMRGLDDAVYVASLFNTLCKGVV